METEKLRQKQKANLSLNPKASSKNSPKEQKGAFDSFLTELLQTQEVNCIGGYILGETIGKGTYGEVRLGIHVLTKQQVAVKVMGRSYAPLALREVQTWRYLRHPNIAQLYEVITTQTHIYLVMEHASRGEVFEHIVTRGRMKEKEAKKIFLQLVSAIDYAHQKNIVHRDLKPENLLLDSNDNLKLIDFGFAKKFDPGKFLETHCGSVSYVAPEIVKKDKYSGPESDVWSLGVILFALLCGRLPFDDESDARIFEKILTLNYKIDSSCSSAAQDLIQKILKFDPKERLTTAQILEHPWFKEDEAEGVFSRRIEGTDQVGEVEEDQEIIEKMKALGLDVQHLEISLKNYQPDQLSALFFLLRLANNGKAPQPYSSDIYYPRLQKESNMVFGGSEPDPSVKSSIKSELNPLSPIKNRKPSSRRHTLQEERRPYRKGSLPGDFEVSDVIKEEEEEEKESDHHTAVRANSVSNLVLDNPSPSPELLISPRGSSLDKSFNRTGSGSFTKTKMKTLFSKKEVPKTRGRTASLDARYTLEELGLLIEGSNSSAIREVKEGVFDHHNTSTRSPIDLAREVIKVLTRYSIVYERENYRFTISGDPYHLSEMTSGTGRRAMDLERDGLELAEPEGEGSDTSLPDLLCAPRLVDHLSSEASDSSDGGARDSLEANEDENQNEENEAENGTEAEAEAGEGGPRGKENGAQLKKEIKLELEICHLGAKLHGLRLRRLGGDLWLYKDFCEKLLSEMRL